MKNEPLTLTPHWGDRARDTFHAWRNPNKIEITALFVSAVLFGCTVVAIVNQ